MYVSDRHDMTFAIKAALSPNTANHLDMKYQIGFMLWFEGYNVHFSPGF